MLSMDDEVSGMKLAGHVDLCGPERIEGWLYCDAWDGQVIKLQVCIDDSLVGECVVDRFRVDLQEAGFGEGHCGFNFEIPFDLPVSDFASKLQLVDSPVYLLLSADTKLPQSGEETTSIFLDEEPKKASRTISSEKKQGLPVRRLWIRT